MSANPVLLDANLLVLLVVGAASLDYIARHKRLRGYTPRDYDLLVRMLAAAPAVFVTPNTVTEASNLARQIDDPARSEIAEVLQTFLSNTEETYIASAQAARSADYIRLGITDAGLLDQAFANHVLLTADLGLYLAAAAERRQAINFIHHIEANR